MRYTSSFDGDKKIGISFLHRPECWLRSALVPLVPAWLETQHLTLLTIVWAMLSLLFSYLSQTNLAWLWAVSSMIVAQYVSDLLDGEIGRRRGTGLIKWGYYMDHFLDYLFLCALIIGYFFILPPRFIYSHFFLLAICGGYMVNSFLAFAVTNKFQVSYFGFGPTEIRIAFIGVNSLLALFGVTHLAFLQPYVLAGAAFGLIVTVYRTQKSIWKMDMEHKNSSTAPLQGLPIDR